MIDEIGMSQESVADSAATGETMSDVDNSATTETPSPEVVTEQTQESTEKVETQEQKTEDDSKIPENFRVHLKELEADIKEKYKPTYTGLEKTATELFGAATPEDVQATVQTMQALAPSIKVLTDPLANQADVVSTLQKMLPPEHLETLTWAALNDPATQNIIFDDPEVLQTISEKLFQGRTIQEIQSLLENAPATDPDPERDAWRKEQSDFKAEQARIKSESAQRTANERSQQLMTRFFETPAQQVIAEDFKLVAPDGANEADKQLYSDTAKDIRFAAQGRFLEANMDAYMRVDSLYKSGQVIPAQTLEIQLANKYQATLIKTAQRHANLLKTRSVATVNGQQAKLNGVRPDVTGSVQGEAKAEEKWDIDAPDFAQKFAASFHN